MKPRIYVETSVISYLASRPSREAVNAARQMHAAALWQARKQFHFFILPVVIDESSKGHPAQVAARQAF